MDKINYDIKMHEIIEENRKNNQVPSILLHTCCAPCSSTCITELANDFKVTVLYYNPNIEPYEEYLKRKEEQIRFIKEYQTKYPVSFMDCDYDSESYQEISKRRANDIEGGLSCQDCYRLRLRKTAILAKENHFDYFGTSLTVSPYKNSQVLNQIGDSISKEVGIPYLYSDFKKNNGYLKSIELSKEYHLYRQDYCGCVHSKKEHDIKK